MTTVKSDAVPLLDLKAQFRALEPQIRAAIDEVLESQRFIMGPKVAELEKALAGYCSTPYAFGVSSGTDALLAALMALDLGPGDEGITTPDTFFATAGSISRVGATPVFVDIDPDTFNLAPDALEAALSSRTRAVVVVHLFGQVAEMDPIVGFCRRHDLALIEDAAQAIGAEYRGGRAGSFGDIGCFSFFPSKNLGAFGDGGAVTATAPEIAERLEIVRQHGAKPKYHHAVVGGNFRLDALQAAVLLVKLPHLDGWSAGRQANAARYRRLFVEAGLAGNEAGGGGNGALSQFPLVLPREAPERRHIYNQFVLRVRERDGLLARLREVGVGCEVYYPVALHLQKCFAPLGHGEGDFPVAEEASHQTLAIPVYPELTGRQQERVVEVIADFYGNGPA